MEKLKRCPWCECDKVEIQQNIFGEYFVQCQKCGEKTIKEYIRKDSAIREWNIKRY